jgi:hypothetical protein
MFYKASKGESKYRGIVSVFVFFLLVHSDTNQIKWTEFCTLVLLSAETATDDIEKFACDSLLAALVVLDS